MIVIDRFEGEYAVIEKDGECFSLPKGSLPADAAEGDILEETENGYVVNKQATLHRRTKLMQRLKSISCE